VGEGEQREKNEGGESKIYCNYMLIKIVKFKK
jgi:hypothetical protein